VVDTINGITREVAVVNIKHQIPFRPDEVTVGKLESSFLDMQIGVINNIKKLQQQLASSTDIEIQNINQEKIVEVSGYEKVENATKLADTLYWDDYTTPFGAPYEWGDGTEETYTTTTLLPINSAIYEDFYSTEFKDGTSTATWGTNGVCAFTSGQVALSTYYLKDLDASVNSLFLDATYTGTIIFEISTDGTNWETMVNGATLSSAYNGHYLYWRATEAGSSTANLTRIKITYTVI
jgi:hypothetical protein